MDKALPKNGYNTVIALFTQRLRSPIDKGEKYYKSAYPVQLNCRNELCLLLGCKASAAI